MSRSVEHLAIAETEQALSERLDNPEMIYKACADMKLFNQEVLRVILLNTRLRHVSTVEISRGTINESLAHPREIFRPAVALSAYAVILERRKRGQVKSRRGFCQGTRTGTA